MALFTDGPASTVDDMTQHDASLLDVSDVEGINLTTKLALAQEEIGLELDALFQRARNNYSYFLGLAPLDLDHLVVTTPIRLWHTYQSLALVYRDAYYSQLTDRYQGKWDEYQKLARWAKDKLLETGVGLVNDPMPQADAPMITLVAATEAAGTFYLSITFVNAAGEEGTSSTVTPITTTANNAPDVLPVNPPANAAGWNLYAGTAPTALFLQNSSPLAIGQDFTFFPSLAVTTGTTPGPGQTPNVTRALPRLLQRG